ncbi:hypothetical protein TYRP_019993 [Tyrophagus putrescentiae]|nr:hypothetical protein TYRP_019993 [Tyrophagus putrescentiae]
MKFQWDIEDAFNVDPYGPGNKDNLEGHKRRIFVQKVYAILGVAVTITLANALLTMIFMGRFISYSWQNDVNGCVVYLAMGLTFFFWCSISYISLRTELDFTVHKLFIWSVELIWLFVFVGLWMFIDYRELLVLWATLGLVISMMQLAVDTQMVSGGLEHSYSVHQYLLAPLSLYWDIMLLFLLTMPIVGAIITSSFAAIFE